MTERTLLDTTALARFHRSALYMRAVYTGEIADPGFTKDHELADMVCWGLAGKFDDLYAVAEASTRHTKIFKTTNEEAAKAGKKAVLVSEAIEAMALRESVNERLKMLGHDITSDKVELMQLHCVAPTSKWPYDLELRIPVVTDKRVINIKVVGSVDEVNQGLFATTQWDFATHCMASLPWKAPKEGIMLFVERLYPHRTKVLSLATTGGRFNPDRFEHIGRTLFDPDYQALLKHI